MTATIDVETFRLLARKRGARVEIAWYPNAERAYFELWLVERDGRRQLTTFRGRPRHFRHPDTVLRFLADANIRRATLLRH